MRIGTLYASFAVADGGSGNEPPDSPIGSVSGGDGNEPPGPAVTAEQPASRQTESYLQHEGLSLSDCLSMLAGVVIIIGLYRVTRRTGRKE